MEAVLVGAVVVGLWMVHSRKPGLNAAGRAEQNVLAQMRVSMATNKLKNQYYPSQDAGTVCSTSGPGCELPPHPLALTTAGREELNALARLRVYESKKKLKELYPTYVTITKEEQMNPAHFASLFS